MYFRTEGFTADDGILYAKASGAKVSFDTYFNLVPVRKFKKYCNLSSITFEISADGEYLAEAVTYDGGNEEVLASGTGSPIVHMSDVPDSALYLYLRITVLSERLTINNISAYADSADTREINPAIVICTYQREEYAIKNAVFLAESMNADNANGQIIVVDNGRTLKDFDNTRITLLPNDNTGGSGGFKRGMEYAAQGDFTHVILMDDDVSFEYVSFQKLFGFLRLVRDETISISGTMLYLDKPTVQFEAGGHFSQSGEQIGFGHFLDLSETENLIENEQDKDINYGGWWFMCMPSKYIYEGNFPLPFFLKYDDVEYALRCKLKIITLNGVGVWHKKFEDKYNSYCEYYSTRNYLLLCKLHCNEFSEKQARKFVKTRIKAKNKRQQYQMAEAIKKGYSDYLKGVEYLNGINAQENHNEICKLNYKYMTYDEIEQKYGVKPLRDHFYAPPGRRGLLQALIPKRYVFTDCFYDKPIQYLAARAAFHCDGERNCAYVTTRDPHNKFQERKR